MWNKIIQKKNCRGADLHPQTIKRLFEEQVKGLTMSTLLRKEDSFDLQYSGGWLR